MYKKLLTQIIVGIIPATAFAAAPGNFGAGQILQTVKPNIASPVQPLPPVIHNKLNQSKGERSGLTVLIKSFMIKGNTIFREKTLHDLIKDGEGKRLTFAQLRSYADKITDFYKKNGYPFDRAFFPKQTIGKDGVAIIQIEEVIYGEISIHNTSRINNSLVASTISDLRIGEHVKSDSLDHDLLLLSDLPGQHTVSTLSPGLLPETTNLDIDLIEKSMFSGNISVDDYGDPYTGSFRLNGTGEVSNLFHHGDILTVNGTTSFGGFEYGLISYESVLNGYGTKAGIGYSAMDYRLGGGVSPIAYGGNASSLAALGASGYAQTMSGWVFQPIIRRTKGDLSLRLGYDHYIVSDTFNQSAGAGNNRTLDVLAATLTGDRKDGIFGGGSNDFNLTYSPYFLAVGAGETPANDPYSVSTPGFRSVWRGLIERTQNLPGSGNSLFISGNGQFATGALDPVQQFVLGGPQSIRGYSTAVLFGNEGFTSTVEARHDWTTSNFPGVFQNSVFFDAAGVSYGNEFLDLLSPGVGETWTDPFGWFVKFQLGVPVGGEPTIVGKTSPVQAWFQVVKTF